MHGWRLPPGKNCLYFKTMKNIEIEDPGLSSHHCMANYTLVNTH